jgi:hypothetical protein
MENKWRYESELELYRKKVLQAESQIALLKRQLAEETKDRYALLNRIKELTSNDT